MKSQVDHIWIIAALGIVVLIFAWPTLTGWFGVVKGQVINQDQLDRGKLVFYDDVIFSGEGSYRSCATCHAPDYTPPDGVEITMKDYVKGQPFILKGIKANYGTNLLTSIDPLFSQFTRCMTSPDRMGCGRVSRNAKHVQDLIEYVRVQ